MLYQYLPLSKGNYIIGCIDNTYISLILHSCIRSVRLCYNVKVVHTSIDEHSMEGGEFFGINICEYCRSHYSGIDSCGCFSLAGAPQKVGRL